MPTPESPDSLGREAAWTAFLEHGRDAMHSRSTYSDSCHGCSNAAIDAYLKEADLVPREIMEALIERATSKRRG